MATPARLGSALLVLALLVAPATARAGDCTDSPEVARIRAQLGAESRKADLWNGTFTGLFVASAVGSLALAPQFDDNDAQRASMYWTSAKSTIAAIAALITPMKVPTLPACTDEDEARAALARAAASQRRARHWMRHAEALALNAVGIGILGLGYGYWREALVNTGLGLVVGEIRIFTAPTGALHMTIEAAPVIVPETGTVGAGVLIRF